ncbi:FMRFamide-activated amiloride-sensitive sodium channel-like [Bolinopsis microptera]|uniref:FMRFamide-activated amiloride-sensitive sodium channel-like n=1 Tax=Bolinopsis microptera TaxID=2820187 RepID=UPI0030795A5B
MVVLTVEPWELEGEKNVDTVSVTASQPAQLLFGFQDLASDYFQVLQQKSRPRFCRIIWAILIFTLAGFTCYLSYRLLTNYFKYDSFNKSVIEWRSGVVLPAISVCGTNYLNYSKLKTALAADNESEEHREGETLQEEFDALVTDFRKYESYGVNLTAEDLERAEDLKHWEDKKGSIAVRFRNDILDMVVGHFEFLFRGVGYHITEENRAEMTNPTELGMCLEINDKGELVQDVLGKNGRLTIDVDAKVNDYLFTTSSKGFVVFIRDYDETVMLNQGGYLVAPGTETFLKLSAKNVTRLGKPHGTCQNKLSKYSKYGKRFEGVRECQERQQIEAMINHCHCIPWYFAERMYTEKRLNVLDDAVAEVKKAQSGKKRSTSSEAEHETHTETGTETETENETETDTETDNHDKTENNIPHSPHINHRVVGKAKDSPVFHSNYTEYICTFVQQNLCNGLISNEIKEGILQMEECHEPCTYNEWDVEMDTTVFPPTKEYFEHFVKFDAHLRDEADFSYARENMARIHIFYKDLKVDKLSQMKAYDESSFIAEFGGTVDIFIGFSFFTVAQLIEIAIAGLIRRIQARRNIAHQEKATSGTVNTEIEAQTPENDADKKDFKTYGNRSALEEGNAVKEPTVAAESTISEVFGRLVGGT